MLDIIPSSKNELTLPVLTRRRSFAMLTMPVGMELSSDRHTLEN